ncbi:hypothetical protein [Vibrio sp. RE88]|uniref:hypothetical protein n=1 Tax=Vibrio sp. RE88 TaxID=2607610 RepID=UPI00149394A9|nr:hypothetical protein [Vibrio sp. RE88]NOH62792.1 hypothetical protein [Vibrio sp. RE88]
MDNNEIIRVWSFTALEIRRANLLDVSTLIDVYIRKICCDVEHKFDYKGCFNYFLMFIEQDSKQLYIFEELNECIGMLLVRSEKRPTHKTIDVWDELFYLDKSYINQDTMNNIMRNVKKFSVYKEDQFLLPVNTYFDGRIGDRLSITAKAKL